MLSLLAFATSAAGQTAKCSTLDIGSFLFLSFDTVATFPNPSESITRSFSQESFNFNQCGYSISSDKNKLSIKAKSLNDLFRLVNSRSPGYKIFSFAAASISGYKYPSIKEGFFYYPVNINIDTTTRRVTGEDKSSGFLDDTSIGYKINGGPLKPFYYEGRFQPFSYPSGIQNLNFYILPSDFSTDSVQRIQVDFLNSAISIWNMHSFPAK
ncbi:hypothetical protein [Deinococcus seoulensis]|uniref:hypothetical protein n=1 Tax=Deinococcus seoulensis TaxID=1837379 RepID=UPI0016698202|nr:hypothetical protein [Deinococcus seoulensis]